MIIKKLRYILILAVAALSFSGMSNEMMAEPQKKGTTTNRRTNNKSNATKQQPAKQPQQAPPSAATQEAQKQQAQTQKEIKQTEQDLRQNDASIKKGLNELGKLEGDISTSKSKIANLTGKINTLSGQISSLQKNIGKNETELQKLRDEYLKAIKKMRVARKSTSDLAFVFSSKNFNQAIRRMRYLKEFSKWKDRQSEEINKKIAVLKKEKDDLAKAKTEEDRALKDQKVENAKLESQYARQDAIVVELKKNGEALKTHLSKKQAEANELRNRISSLIAEDQRRFAAEQERIAAEERRKEQERLAAEEKRRAEQERIAAEQRKREEQERLAAQQREAERLRKEKEAQALAENNKKQTTPGESGTTVAEAKPAQGVTKRKVTQENKEQTSTAAVRERKKKEEEKNISSSQTSGQSYAEARKRTPRGNQSASNTQASSSATTASVAKPQAGGFAGMKGSLPRPVSGAFKVTSRFGQHALPDLPDVVYDNPGIDAEVSAGASALAVYEGRVSGIYMLPGYNNVVIVNHGSYYTVYGNIGSPSVKIGDNVKAGQQLGKLAPDEDDSRHSSIHFEVWKNREKLNPLEWIR